MPRDQYASAPTTIQLTSGDTRQVEKRFDRPGTFRVAARYVMTVVALAGRVRRIRVHREAPAGVDRGHHDRRRHTHHGRPMGDSTPGPITVAIRDQFWALMDEPSPLIEAIDY
jgi:hypothetical protein